MEDDQQPETRRRSGAGDKPRGEVEAEPISVIGAKITITGDIHSNWVNDLRVDDRQPETPVVATEFVGTSIASGGNGKAETPGLEKRMAENACIKFFNAQRGYVRCTVTPKAWRSDYQVVEEVTKPGAPVVARASFVVEAGAAGAKRA